MNNQNEMHCSKTEQMVDCKNASYKCKSSIILSATESEYRNALKNSVNIVFDLCFSTGLETINLESIIVNSKEFWIENIQNIDNIIISEIAKDPKQGYLDSEYAKFNIILNVQQEDGTITQEEVQLLCKNAKINLRFGYVPVQNSDRPSSTTTENNKLSNRKRARA
ncbi:hypothetical protein IOLA_254 [uncultured bacterium]|nr:hypothetical protein IOLA_254 [uncultured bacterium]